MKVLCKIFLLILSSFVLTPNAFAAEGQGESVCNIGNDYYDSAQIVTGTFGSYSPGDQGSAPIYDITSVKIVDGKLEIHGWAFNKGIHNDLGGVRTIDTLDDAFVSFALAKRGSNDESTYIQIPESNIQYAVPGNGNCYYNGCMGGSTPKYYNFTYWNCRRTSKNSDSGGKCIEAYTSYITGGFRVTIDVDTLPKGNYYLLKMKYTSKNPNNRLPAKWIDISAHENSVYKSVDDYNEVSHDITITGFGETAEVVVSSGRIIGPSGLYCDSPAVAAGTPPASTYFEIGKSYPIAKYDLEDDSTSTNYYEGWVCRGGDENYGGANNVQHQNCYYNSSTNRPDWGAGMIITYPLKVDMGSVYKKSGTSKYYAPPASSSDSGQKAYAPASWLKFDGQIAISTGQPSEELNPSCEGRDVYNYYYLFLAGVSDGYDKTMTTSAKGSRFNDFLIFQELGVESLNGITMDSGIYTINKTNVEEYYNWLKAATSSPRRYYQNGNDYYIAYNAWCTTDEAGNEITCYNAMTGCVLDANGNDTSDCSTGAFVNNGNFDIQQYLNATTNVDGTMTITPSKNENNNGYVFNIARDFVAHPNGRYKLLNPNQKTVKVGSNSLHPAVYKVAWCKNEEPDCDDNVQSAVCQDSGTGTEVVFHENYDIETCTIEKGNRSGFTAIELSETTGYCEMACKEDLDIYLPSTKETAAGQYFVLDNYTPKIDAKRTCATTEIDYSAFTDELKAMEEELVELYNRWQDWIYIEKTAVKMPPLTVNGPYQCHCTGCENNPNPACVCTPQHSTKYSWTREGVSDTPNGLESLTTRNGDWIEGHDATGRDERKSSWNMDVVQPLQNAKNTYSAALNAYVNKINMYNRCFNWTDATMDAYVQGEYNVVVRSQTSYFDTYEYKFKPYVSFDYADRDGAIFPVEYKYDYDGGDVDGYTSAFEPDEKKTYWPEDSTIDPLYSQGGGSTANKDDTYRLLNCTTETCTLETHKSVSTYFYTSAYVKREEDYKYTYHLPKVYTRVPSGTVSTSPSGGTKLELEDDAVPVNINTEAGTYDYIITIKDIKDRLRKSKEGNNPDDDWDARFASEALNAGDEYVCTYDVINDIYIPEPSKYNFFYRTVDMSDINPTNRVLGYNWTDGRGSIVAQKMAESDADYQVLTNSADRDKFQFTLTPAIMKEIRDYNGTRSLAGGDGYADWDLNCSDYDAGGYHCYSNFLSCLASSGLTRESGQASCNSIFGSSLNEYTRISDYDYDDLRTNRNILINKQNNVDGRGINIP